ncbi:MAG TPA: hypothetical protein VN769_10445 [Xanthobacteraceae bacterium]|nr:hypothetical protein [Xanthobacteraceae bacterium]
MSTPTPSRLTPELRAVFEQLADVLVPAHGKMPAASAVGTHEGLLDDVLKHRPDIRDDLLRALTAAQGREPRAGANDLLRKDAAAFNALGLAVSGAYYMSPRVRELLGYPGQESVSYDPYATPNYLTDGMLERVVARGPIYRPTPR